MPRKKEERVVVTFHTTAAALKMETIAKRDGLPGKLISAPREMSAGCGLAWSSPADQKERIQALLISNRIGSEEITVLLC